MNRRQFGQGLSLLGLSAMLPKLGSSHANTNILYREIPASGERIPVIGMGSWITFNVSGDKNREANMKAVLSEFHRLGGRVIDSSPMYGSSEVVIGKLADDLGIMNDLWVSTKIWTDGKANGQRQLSSSNTMFSHRVMVDHVHNMRDIEEHFATLLDAKEAGLIKYTGITHYLNGYHSRLGELILKYKPDFIQINYNIENTNAEKKLIPLARDKGVAVIINRPFQTGALFRRIRNAKLPPWATDYGIDNWANYMLKFIISLEGVTCVIPATTQVAHVRQNIAAGTGHIPTKQARDKMQKHFMSII